MGRAAGPRGPYARGRSTQSQAAQAGGPLSPQDVHESVGRLAADRARGNVDGSRAGVQGGEREPACCCRGAAHRHPAEVRCGRPGRSAQGRARRSHLGTSPARARAAHWRPGRGAPRTSCEDLERGRGRCSPDATRDSCRAGCPRACLREDDGSSVCVEARGRGGHQLQHERADRARHP